MTTGVPATVDLTRASAFLGEQIPALLLVYVFGSHATGTTTAESDIDLAVLARSPLAPVERLRLQEELASLLHTSVDLIDLQRATTVLRVQVLEHGREIYCASPYERDLFEATTLSDYTRLNEERRGILEDVKARGSIYG